jgi:hypothetical protein
MKRRFLYTVTGLALLAILAGVTLEGNIRYATWVFLGGIAIKTYLSVLRDTLD